MSLGLALDMRGTIERVHGGRLSILDGITRGTEVVDVADRLQAAVMHTYAIQALEEALDEAAVETVAPLAEWSYEWHRWGRYADDLRLWAATGYGVGQEDVLERAAYTLRHRMLLGLEPDQAAQVAAACLEGWAWRVSR